MRKQNGFVFMETVVVVSILSVTLMMLYGSYAFILKKSRERNAYDTTEMIYKTYNIKKMIDTEMKSNAAVKQYFQKHLTASVAETYPLCTNKTMSGVTLYECDLTKTQDMYSAFKVYKAYKMYYLNPKQIMTNPDYKAILKQLDATTIDYIRSISDTDKNLLVVKYIETYGSGASERKETFHASMGVN